MLGTEKNGRSATLPQKGKIMTERNVTLDLLRSYDGEPLRAVRGDTESRRFIFTLCHGKSMIALGDGVTVLFCCEIDGVKMTDACEISDGKAICTLKNSFTAKAGTFPCELAVYKDSGENLKKLFCTGIELYVEDSFADLEGIEADDRFAALDVLVNRAEAAARDAENLVLSQKSLEGGYGIAVEGNVISLSLPDGEAVSY